MTDSRRLLADYVENGSETAFRELVARYIDLVYSSAVRLVNGDTHLAEDVAQTVFIDLARKARTFSNDVMLGGWLHRHTCFVAGKIIRGERRRQSRERQAVEMNALQKHSEEDLTQIAPILDEAINQLGAEDRTAILLRFFEQRDFHSVGEALGSSEDAARMRVTRALEKLHALLKHRGVAFSATALGTALAAEAVTAAPAGLAISITSAALATAAGTGATLSLIKLITMTKFQTAIIGAIAVAAVAAPLAIQQHQTQVRLREENETLREQVGRIEALEVENQRLSNEIVQAKNSQSLPSDQLNELLRLRSEVQQLEAEAQRLAQLNQAADLRAADPAALSQELKGGIKQLVTSDNYTWVETSEGGRAEGKINKDGLMYVVRNNNMESVMKGGKFAIKGLNGWMIAHASPGREVGGVLRNRTDPAVQADDLVSKVQELKSRGEGVYFGDLTEEGATRLVAFGGPDGERGLRLVGAKGTATFWVKEGTLAKFEYHLEGRVLFTAGEHEFNATTTIEFKDFGTTTIVLPDEAERVLTK